ncbi:Centrosomal protein of 19 kDa [Biomphalaria glabrata]|uniref:Centrosomal protein of 19 kDa n=1 Tax=Biomphalaria glabrata TaxID=6526 RepID=A0A9U8ELQ4_BIOGL|nr:centrosomal protein of 19 kDa-like [Biomphalaria glabrata]XP_055868090.1 centrosomal protein of 19 kDa-like [Biomphalaria glabrata]XP_055868091.1 centrosomal protein of 19 kDa-like [Biomphalaria glabrata]KAI8751717.1 centrosomal protein of 19 kDa-like [Biomphalaria glabrata]KAI8770842.1 centrosomal protein of 19 kDa [Biomphalaria glabrata]
MADTLQILKCGVRFDPPALVLNYKDRKTGKLRSRSMPLRNFNKNSGIDRIMQELESNPRHSKFIRLMSPAQLQRLLTIVKDKLNGLSLEASIARNNLMDQINPEENLNKVDPEILQRKKLLMDSSFEKKRIKPGDPQFEYNVEVDFDEVAIETSNWDSDNSEIDF